MNDAGDVIETTTTGDRLPSGVGFVGCALDAGVSLTSKARSSAGLQSSFVKPKYLVSFEISNR